MRRVSAMQSQERSPDLKDFRNQRYSPMRMGYDKDYDIDDNQEAFKNVLKDVDNIFSDGDDDEDIFAPPGSSYKVQMNQPASSQMSMFSNQMKPNLSQQQLHQPPLA